MRKVNLAFAAAAIAMLSGCGSGTPATVDQVKDLMKKDLGTDGYTVSWVGVEPTGQPGEFKVILDRRKGDDVKSEQTMLCNVSATSTTNTRTCQTAEPSIMNMAADTLTKQYEARKLEVRDYTLKRTGEGTKFAGTFTIADPSSGEEVKVPCSGDQKDTKFDINCEQAGAADTADSTEAADATEAAEAE